MITTNIQCRNFRTLINHIGSGEEENNDPTIGSFANRCKKTKGKYHPLCFNITRDDSIKEENVDGSRFFSHGGP